MSITTVSVNGTSLNLSNVEWSVAVDHGRNDITSPPQASSAELTIRGFTTIPVAVSDVLQIKANGVNRFTGRVTDLEISHDYSPTGAYVGRLRVSAMGNLAKLGTINVGAAGYVEEALNYRVANILNETAVTYTANTDPYMVQLAQAAADAQPALTLLSDLCSSTGATMCDLPDGSILFESYSRRGYGYNPATFAQVPDQFSAVPYIWADVYNRVTAAPIPVALPNTGVVWEPIWKRSLLTVVNKITVQYDGTTPPAEIVATDASSITTHGQRAVILSTQLADGADAYDRAYAILTAQSEPRYNLTQVQIFVDQLDATTRTAVLGLIQGSRVTLTNVPQPAPAASYMGVVEGWSESYTPTGHILTVSLSDPRYSYAMAKWSEISTTITWLTMNQTVKWYDVVQPADMLAA